MATYNKAFPSTYLNSSGAPSMTTHLGHGWEPLPPGDSKNQPHPPPPTVFYFPHEPDPRSHPAGIKPGTSFRQAAPETIRIRILPLMPNHVYEVTDADGFVLYRYAAANANPYPTPGTPALTISYFDTDQVAAVIPSGLTVTPTTDVDVPIPTGFWLVFKDGAQTARIPADPALQPDATTTPGTTVVFMNQWNPAAWVSQANNTVLIRECCLITATPKPPSA